LVTVTLNYGAKWFSFAVTSSLSIREKRQQIDKLGLPGHLGKRTRYLKIVAGAQFK
jgi:hypothetical protein